MRVENRAGLSPASQIPEYRDYEASTNLSSIRGFVRVLLWGGTRIRTFWNRYRTIVSRYLTVTSFESRQIVDTDPVPRGILTQVHSHDDLFQLGRGDGSTLEPSERENITDFFQCITFPQREQIHRLTTNYR